MEPVNNGLTEPQSGCLIFPPKHGSAPGHWQAALLALSEQAAAPQMSAKAVAMAMCNAKGGFLDGRDSAGDKTRFRENGADGALKRNRSPKS
jgi:hypothetical protein